MKTSLLSILTLLPFLLGSGAPALAAPSMDEPIRYAKVKLKAIKLFKEQQADGTYAYKSEVICERTGQAPVFGADAKNPAIDASKALTCETDLKIGRSRLLILSYVSEQKNLDMFGDGQLGDYKAFGSSVWIQSQSGTFAKSLPMGISATDPQARVMALNIWGENLTSDQDGDRVLEERINVIFKFED